MQKQLQTANNNNSKCNNNNNKFNLYSAFLKPKDASQRSENDKIHKQQQIKHKHTLSTVPTAREGRLQ